MSSPSANSPEETVSVNSPVAAGGTIEDSASSTRRMGPPPDVSVQVFSSLLNVAYRSRLADVRSRSISPRPRRTVSLVSLSVAQQRARTAEQKAESAFSSVGVITDRTQYAQAVAEEAIVEARSVREEVSSRIAEVAKCTDVSTSSIAENLEGRVREVAAYTDAHTSRSVGEL